MGNSRGRRRRFGAVRQYRSGRWTASYTGPDGTEQRSPETFATKGEAERWLTLVEADITRQVWVNPETGSELFGEFARQWITDRELSPRSRILYDGLLRNHLEPTFGNRELRKIREADVRRWRRERLDTGAESGAFGAVTVAKAYRLLRAVLNTAVDDELIRRNPCRIKGAGQEDSPERSTLTVEQVYAVADAITPRYRALVLLAAFLGLRFGELGALRRHRVDLDLGVVRVQRSSWEALDGKIYEKDPKTRAGRRTIAMPDVLVPELRRHLEWFADKTPDGLVFIGPRGGRLRGSHFHKVWRRALRKAGLDPSLHLHDLRHTGNTLTAASGASLKELMARMGHASTRAALIYQHATQERDKEIADALNARITTSMRKGKRATKDKAADLVRPGDVAG
jgi:integrase